MKLRVPCAYVVKEMIKVFKKGPPQIVAMMIVILLIRMTLQFLPKACLHCCIFDIRGCKCITFCKCKSYSKLDCKLYRHVYLLHMLNCADVSIVFRVILSNVSKLSKSLCMSCLGNRGTRDTMKAL